MKTKLLVTAILVTTTFISCNTYRYIYSASPANNPYFIKKGDSKLTGDYSIEDETRQAKEYYRGFDLHGAYAFGNHWALTGGYFNRKERDIFNSGNSNTSVVSYKRNLFDIGAGYFTQFKENKELTANVYAGFASGKFFFEDDDYYSSFHESSIDKWFLQPSINFMPGENVRMSLATKVSFVHYGNIKTNYSQGDIIYYSLDQIANQTICFLEPSFNIQFGIPEIPWIKLDLVISGTSGYRSRSSRLDVRGTNASFGLSFDFSKMKKK